MKRDAHVVIDFHDGGSFKCRRCGVWYKPTYPCPLNMWLAMGAAFRKDHRNCPPRTEGEQPLADTGFADPIASLEARVKAGRK